MNYLVRNSIKVGLIASAMLVFSACGSDEPSGSSNNPKVNKPLFDQQPIEAGDVCEFGGTMVRGGLDEDEDGELSDTEAKSKTPICNAEGQSPDGPPLVVKTETLEIGDAACEHGGKRVHVGYDIDKDDELSAAEIAAETTKTTDLCNSGPADVCIGEAQLEIVSIELAEDEFGFYEIDRPYEVRVEFNKEIDATSLELKDILKTLGEDVLVYTVDPTNNKIAILELTVAVNKSYSMAIAANDGCTTGSAGLRTPTFHLQQSRIAVSYEAEGFTAVGETIKFCYETRSADTCTTAIRGDNNGTAPTSACIDIVATQADITAKAVTVHVVCRNSAKPGSQIAIHSRALPTIPTMISFDSKDFAGLENAGEVELHWGTFRMDSCTLSDGTATVDVPVNQLKHAVQVEETTEFTLTCKDADANEYSKKRRIVVGPGILKFEASVTQRAPGFPLQYNANWETSLLYGSCDINLDYGTSTLVSNNYIQSSNWMVHPYYRYGILNIGDSNSTQNLDPLVQGTAKLTCNSLVANASSLTLEVPIRQY